MKKGLKEKTISHLHVLLIIVGSIFISLSVFHSNLWFDEAYTVQMVNHSFLDIWKIGAFDVHPILYYWILHFISIILGNSILIYRLFSTLCFILLGIIGYTHIRKDFGKETGLIFTFLVFFLPTTAFYAGEIRMYGLGMLLGTLLIIYGYRLLKGNKNKFTLPIFAVVSLFLAYTHYYGLILAGIINLGLFIFFLIHRNERKKDFISFIIQATIQVLLYIPWLICLLGQLKSVSQGFWISLSFPDTLFEVINTQFQGNLPIIAGLILAIIMYIYCIITLIKLKKEERKLPLWCFGIYFGIIILALIVSLTMGSVILLYRYLLIISGLLLLSFAYLLAKSKNYTLKILLGIIVMCFSIYNTVLLIQENYSDNKGASYLLENIKENDIILYSDVINGVVLTTQISSKVNNISYFYNKENWNVEQAYQAFNPTMEIVDDYQELLRKNKEVGVWVIDNNSLAKEIAEESELSIVSTESFYQKYKNLNFTITLIKKQP